MSLNRTIRSLKVKKMIAEWRTSGGAWGQSGQGIFVPGRDMRFTAIFGHTYGLIEWDRDLYDKEGIRVLFNPLGIRTNKGYIHRDALQYFPTGGFNNGTSRPEVQELEGPFKTTHADVAFRLYARSMPPLANFPVTRFRFAVTINAAIRNERSHQVRLED